MLGKYIKGSKRGGKLAVSADPPLINSSLWPCETRQDESRKNTKAFFPRITLDTSECSDVRRDRGGEEGSRSLCSSEKTQKLLKEFGQANSEEGERFPWLQIYKKTGCQTESCVLAQPSFQKFVESKGFGSRFLDKELDINFKASGPRDSTAWLSNSNIDETFQRWAQKFDDFYPCPFTIADFEEMEDRFATIDMIGVLEGYEPVELETEIGVKKRPHTSFGCCLNTDTSQGPGKHWTCIFVDCRGYDEWSVEWFNSAGHPPEAPVIRWLERTRFKLQNYRKNIPTDINVKFFEPCDTTANTAPNLRKELGSSGLPISGRNSSFFRTPDRKKYLGMIRENQKVINPEMQEEYAIVCDEFYVYFRKNYSKYIGIINPAKFTPPYKEYIYCSPSKWIEAKKHQLRRRLDKAVYGPIPDFSVRFMFELISTISYYEKYYVAVKNGPDTPFLLVR
ncbi:cysteine protease [Rhizophagus clarus]|uniref:Cysteine protease n=2 Tax=Rhizophagus clarus TaxID=94130 RepID=A0A8H3LWV8_9GLOM|nr:cysteine protease [Rhizophagus clarus]